MLPAVVLVRPQHEGNVGAVARAMANMGLTELHLVEPATELGDGAFAMAMHAHPILHGAQRHATLADALGKFHYIVATASLRDRLWPHPVVPPRELAQHLESHASGARVALVFGAEVSGLTSEEISRASVLVSIPAAPANPTLNLAQAVLLVAYELRLASLPFPERAPGPVAEVGEMETALAELQAGLVGIGYLNAQNPDAILAELRVVLARVAPSPREVALLRGLARQLRWAGEQIADRPARRP